MKVIVAGSRTITDPHVVAHAIATSGFNVTQIVCGGARGVDMLGAAWAESRVIPVRHFPAMWAHGKMAGPLRNRAMAAYADALVAVWDGKSRGTLDMISVAKARGLATYVHRAGLWLVNP